VRQHGIHKEQFGNGGFAAAYRADQDDLGIHFFDNNISLSNYHGLNQECNTLKVKHDLYP
jgi:hypothetical protein